MDPPSTMAFAQGIFPALKRHSSACLAEPLPDNLQIQYCYSETQVSEANASRQRTRAAQGTCHPSAPAMLALSSDRPRIEQAINDLPPIGHGTYSTLGVLWAHRMLSYSWKRVWGDAVHPLDPGDDNHALRKAIVLLTDGEDNYCGSADGACMSSEVGIDRSEACALAKNAGTEIFVVAAMAPDKVAGGLAQSLRSCSSESDNPDGKYVFTNNDDEDDLRAAFVEIANQLQKNSKAVLTAPTRPSSTPYLVRNARPGVQPGLPSIEGADPGLLDRDDVFVLDTEASGVGAHAEVIEIVAVDTTGRFGCCNATAAYRLRYRKISTAPGGRGWLSVAPFSVGRRSAGRRGGPLSWRARHLGAVTGAPAALTTRIRTGCR